MREKKVRRLFWAWEFDKEEKWLNEMAQEGWLLDGVGLCTYRFAACEPGEYTVRLEMHPLDQKYIDFMKETGAQYVGRCMQWMYFRKKAADGAFDLFSDIDSRMEHLKRIERLLCGLALGNLALGISNSMNAPHVGWINLLVASLLTYGLGRLHGKREALQEKRLLME